MTPARLRQRAALMARNDAALARWPERSGRAFTSEMAAVAAALEKLARTAPADDDPVELARTWRWAGNARFDLGAGRDLAALAQAERAFREAEAVLPGTADAVEFVKLNYSLGQTLLLLSDGRQLGLATEARSRLREALALAREHMPEGVASVQHELAVAEKVTAALEQVGQLDHQAVTLEGELKRSDAKALHAADARLITDAFALLQQQFEKERPQLDPVREAGLQSLMQRLGDVVRGGTREGNTLQHMMANRGRLEALQRELAPQVKRPSLRGAPAAPGPHGERLLAALQELKLFVGAAGMAQGCPDGQRDAAMELFARLGRLTTWISEAGGDGDRIRKLETDNARALGHEVRMFATRQHLMLAQPVWPDVDSPVDANRICFSGGAQMRSALAEALGDMQLELAAEARPGADFAGQRWSALRSANVAVFDLAESAAQVYYELGIALAAGKQILLLAREDTEIPFDIDQVVCRYAPGRHLREWLADQVDGVLYGLQFRAGRASSLAATCAYAAWLAGAAADNPLVGVALKALQGAGEDPIKFNDALASFNTFLGKHEHAVLQTRWPGVYPIPGQCRCFAVMPLKPEREPAYAVIDAAARAMEVRLERGDQAEGQEIIQSIWQEICIATHVTVDLSGFNLNVCLELGLADTLGRPTLLIGEQGTEKRLGEALPSIAKRRCHVYAANPARTPEFTQALSRFFCAA